MKEEDKRELELVRKKEQKAQKQILEAFEIWTKKYYDKNEKKKQKKNLENVV